jgi:hypothetical protein
VRKTFAIWGVLILVFVGLYVIAGGMGRGTVAMVGIMTGCLVIILAIATASTLRMVRQFQTENTEAVAALGRGELESARATFAQWAETTKYPRLAAVANHTRGWPLARLGLLERAIVIAAANDERRLSALAANGLAPTSAVDLALYHALTNRLDDARRWLGVADGRKSMLALPSVPAMRAMAQAVIDCRAGNAAEAARALDERWHEYEALLTGDIVRHLRVVRAFARASAGPREAGTAAMDLGSVRPAYRGEYAMLSIGWPEMAAFLAAHELG